MAGLPPPSPDQTYVTISPIHGGEITLLERAFVVPNDPNATMSIPSLSFLITHPSPKAQDSTPTRLLFDLGLRSRAQDYIPKQEAHLESRAPYKLDPGVAQHLRNGGLDPAKIDMIMFSHVHYDHHGDPAHFPRAQFIVGPGSLQLLHEGLSSTASHQVFDANLFPDPERVRELPPTESGEWQALGPFDAALDLFGDGSVYVIDAPGHLPGHINLLCRVGVEKWIYLAGDSCHDPRLLSGEREIATWVDDAGHTHCIHLDRERAKETLGRIRELGRVAPGAVEVVLAHDAGWWVLNRHRAFPLTLG